MCGCMRARVYVNMYRTYTLMYCVCVNYCYFVYYVQLQQCQVDNNELTMSLLLRPQERKNTVDFEC